jgi:hypothetical protein
MRFEVLRRNGAQCRSALFESAAFLMSSHMAGMTATGLEARPMPARRGAWAVYEVFKTAGDGQLFIGVTSDQQWTPWHANALLWFSATSAPLMLVMHFTKPIFESFSPSRGLRVAAASRTRALKQNLPVTRHLSVLILLVDRTLSWQNRS